MQPVISEKGSAKELEGERIVYDRKEKKAVIEKAFKDEDEQKTASSLFTEEIVTKGDCFIATLPFLQNLIEPTKHNPINTTRPKVTYDLEYVYGYRIQDCRQNLYFTHDGKVVYNASALGIVLNPKDNTQRFFGVGSTNTSATTISERHNKDIVCLSISPNRKFVATGQAGAKPYFYIWSVDTCKVKGPKTKFRITTKRARAICACSWSADGNYVAFIDKSDKPLVYIMDATTGKITNTSIMGSFKVFDIAWTKKIGEYIFATCGLKHIQFWDMKDMKPKQGTEQQTFACLTYDSNGACYAGALDGNVYIFDKEVMIAKKLLHTGLIHTVTWIEDRLYTGGADNIVCVLTSTMEIESKMNFETIPRAIDKQGTDLLVGLRDGTISLMRNGKLLDNLMRSHHDGEIWGLEVLSDGRVITGCDDNRIMLWDSKTHKLKGIYPINKKPGGKEIYGASSIASLPDNQCCRSICYNPFTKDVAIANNSGEVQIRKVDKLEAIKKSLKAANKWIEAMTYSPDGKYLAVGTHESSLIIYNVSDYSVKKIFKELKGAVTAIDWTTDSRYIRLNSEIYELLYFNIKTEQHDPSGALNTKNAEWATQNTKVAWEVAGIFPKGVDGTHINGVCLSEDRNLVVTGDDWGLVSIYNYPCVDGCHSKSFKGHSEQVIRVKFGMNDNYIFSVGGYDKTLMQWKRA